MKSFTFVSFSTKMQYPRGAESYKSLGTAFEELSQRALSSLGITSYIYGGSGDAGVDLRGHWNLRPDLSIPVIAQCKRTSKPLAPLFIRELEGVFQRQATSSNALSFMISRTEATKQSLEHLLSSNVPMIFMMLSGEDDNESFIIKQAIMNLSAQSLVPGLLVTSRRIPKKKGSGFDHLPRFVFEGRLLMEKSAG